MIYLYFHKYLISNYFIQFNKKFIFYSSSKLAEKDKDIDKIFNEKYYNHLDLIYI